MQKLNRQPRFAEFFAGGGMVRAGLGNDWLCSLANDIDPKKAKTYIANWGDKNFILSDIADLDTQTLFQPFDLYWASSPCQDFSLAGKGAGLSGTKSSAFIKWMDKVSAASKAGYAPRLIAFENVSGLLTSNGGDDFAYVLQAFIKLGYRVGALEIDARHFLPQSRPRIFVIACKDDIELPPGLIERSPSSELFNTKRLRAFVDSTAKDIQDNWVWWNLPAPDERIRCLEDIIDVKTNFGWFNSEKTDFLLSIMSRANLEKVESRKAAGGSHIGTVYKRGRPDETGKIRQRAEVRFDGLAGCLRTPGGGSSRQTLLIVDNNEVRARLLSAREAVRLMGLPESYHIPDRYNEAYKIAGDGVAVPIIEFLNIKLFQPLLAADRIKAVA